MRVKYLINAVSLMHIGSQSQKFPGCIFASPQGLIDEALEIGYDGVQIIPMRGATGNEEGVLLYEDAWNATDNFWSALWHHTGSEGMPATLNDWVVSPNSDECAAISSSLASREIPKVVHHFGKEGDILEIHAGLDMTVAEIKQRCLETGMTVCIDTLHLNQYIESRIQRGEYQQKVIVRSRWNEAIEDIIRTLHDLIRVIHVHYEANPKTETHKGTMFTYLIIKIILEQFSPEEEIALVAEYNPGKANLLQPKKVKAMAVQALQDMRKAVSDALFERKWRGAE